MSTALTAIDQVTKVDKQDKPPPVSFGTSHGSPSYMSMVVFSNAAKAVPVARNAITYRRIRLSGYGVVYSTGP